MQCGSNRVFDRRLALESLVQYTSCIRIARLPILPPLITCERRGSLLRDKRDAINVELKLQKRRLEQKALKTEDNPEITFNAETTLLFDVSLIEESNQTSDSSGIFTKSVDSSNVGQYSLNENATKSSSTSQSGNSPSFKSEIIKDNVECESRSCDISGILDKRLLVDGKIINSSINETGEYNLGSLCIRKTGTVDDCVNHQPLRGSNKKEICEKSGNNGRCCNKKHSSNGTNDLKDCKNDLCLSPCKDLVLKCDIFSSVGSVHKSNESAKNVSRKDVLPNKPIVDNGTNIKTSNEDIKHNVQLNTSGNVSRQIVNREKETGKSAPRLIRQNSYTLESPSPELLAYLNKQHLREQVGGNQPPCAMILTETWTRLDDRELNEKCENFKPFHKYNPCKKSRKSWNFEEAKLQWNEEEKCLVSYDSDRVENSQLNRVALREIPPLNAIETSKDLLENDPLITETLMLVDASKQYVENELKVAPASYDGGHDENNADVCVDLKSFNRSRFCSSDEYSGNILMLRPEKDLSVCSSIDTSNMNCGLLPTMNKGESSYCVLRQLHNKQIEELLDKQELELQVLNKSLVETALADDQFASPCLSNLSAVSETSCEGMKVSPPKSNARVFSDTKAAASHAHSPTRSRLPTSCNRRFEFGDSCTPKQRRKTLDVTDIERRKAAVTITAYARGYLVRRLFKTDKVCRILKSIIDSMHCALNLDMDNSCWTPSDIELRERLTVQIAAAVGSLQDVLSLSVKERMAIISADREKKQKQNKVQTPRSPQPGKPVLSSATRRVMMRKQQQELQKKLTMAMQSASCSIESKVRKPRRRLHTFGGCKLSSGTHQQSQSQPQFCHKPSTSRTTNRRPWK